MYLLTILISMIIGITNPDPIYNYSIPSVSGDTIRFTDYRGKKILLVNIATGSTYVSQLGALKQLQDEYGDKANIVAFPSNSFGNEPREGQAILRFCQDN